MAGRRTRGTAARPAEDREQRRSPRPPRRRCRFRCGRLADGGASGWSGHHCPSSTAGPAGTRWWSARSSGPAAAKQGASNRAACGSSSIGPSAGGPSAVTASAASASTGFPGSRSCRAGTCGRVGDGVVASSPRMPEPPSHRAAAHELAAQALELDAGALELGGHTRAPGSPDSPVTSAEPCLPAVRSRGEADSRRADDWYLIRQAVTGLVADEDDLELVGSRRTSPACSRWCRSTGWCATAARRRAWWCSARWCRLRLGRLHEAEANARLPAARRRRPQRPICAEQRAYDRRGMLTLRGVV